MRILHTEASPGWGGQELRILREAEGMRARGHTVVMAVQTGGGLVEPARAAGFEVLELSFRKKQALSCLFSLLRFMRKHNIDVIVTHSSLDAWMGGIAGRLTRRRVVRTRHLSTPIRSGLNSRLLYNTLADFVVTTCAAAVEPIQTQARLPQGRCTSIPTGVDASALTIDPEEVAQFKQQYGIEKEDVVAGTLCVMRGWKGVADLLHAAKALQDQPHLKWLVVGGGVSETYFHEVARKLGVEKQVIFTGHLTPPYVALAAMDIFCLLSWANEGVSQASLQAAWLRKPLVTTTAGGLPEVCVDRKTGLLVPIKAPEAVAKAVAELAADPHQRETMGTAAHALVAKKFTYEQMLDQMERVLAGSESPA